MLTSRIAAVLSFAALAALAAPARANCAMPVGYDATVTISTVTITPTYESCPHAGGMLRENVSTGEIVKLADFCGDASAEGAKPYIDECVPAGTYRYGFATPYTCNASACGTDYYVGTTVKAALDSSCARSAGDSGPTAASSVPWGEDQEICSYGGCSIGLPGGAVPVLGANLAALLAGLALTRRKAKRGGACP